MKDRLLSTAMSLANLHGLSGVTRDMVANVAEVATGSVTYHFGDMKRLRSEMVKRAIETENLNVLAQALAIGHPLALAAPEALRVRAAHTLTQ